MRKLTWLPARRLVLCGAGDHLQTPLRALRCATAPLLQGYYNHNHNTIDQQQHRGGGNSGSYGNSGGNHFNSGNSRGRQQSSYQQQQQREPRSGGGNQYRGGYNDNNDNTNQDDGGFRDPPRRRPDDGNGGGDSRRSPQQFLEQDAKTLADMKRQFKQARSARDRRAIQKDARRLIRRVRVDPSTQDERSVTIVLNCAAAFHVPPTESIEQAVQWMRRNLNGLSPQNIALFANAVGVLQVPDGETILAEEVSPVVQVVAKEMTPVEVVMVLQAFQREHVYDENAELQDALLRQLAPCIAAMPTPQLSTLATVLSRHPLRRRDEAAWRAMGEAIATKTIKDVGRMHSKEAITLLTAAAHLEVPQGQIVQLLQRATTTVGFHTTEQIGDLFRALASIKRLVAEPSEALQQACKELEHALIGRLDRVAEHATVQHVASLWLYSRQCGVELPAAVQQRLAEAIMTELAWSRQRFPQLARIARAAAEQKLPSDAVLVAMSDYAVGRKVQRYGRDGTPLERVTSDDRSLVEIAEARGRLYAHFFAPLVALRVNLETALAANGGTPGESLAHVLPAELLRHVDEAAPRQALLAVEHITKAPADCACRNTANDDALLAAIEARLKADPAAFCERLSTAFVKRSLEVLADAPRAKGVVEALKTIEPKA